MHPSPGSAVLYSHGGGHIALSLDIYDQIIKNYVSNTGVPILAIDYRLAPEVQAPVPVADCYAGLQYLHSNAATLGIDPTRIAIMGDSGGGGISASLTHYAKQKGGPAIAKQILIYPMLDDRNTDHSAHEAIAPFLSWSVDDNVRLSPSPQTNDSQLLSLIKTPSLRPDHRLASSPRQRQMWYI